MLQQRLVLRNDALLLQNVAVTADTVFSVKIDLEAEIEYNISLQKIYYIFRCVKFAKEITSQKLPLKL